MTAPSLNYTMITVNGENIKDDGSTRFSCESTKNEISIAFTTDQSLKYYEVRCTKEDADYGIGIGSLLYSATNISAADSYSYTIYANKSAFNAGDGIYRIGLYAKGSIDGAWDITYLLISSNDYIIAPSDYDGIELGSDEDIPTV